VDVDPEWKKQVVEVAKRPAKERIFPPLPPMKDNLVENEEVNFDFMDSEPDINVVYNAVSILPTEYDIVSKVKDSYEDFDPEDMANHRPMCYYVTNFGCVEDQKVVFENPNGSMKSHLKIVFIPARVDDIGINKVLVDGGAAINLMPQILLRKIGKLDTDLKPLNIVLSNYEGKVGHSLGAIQVNLIVGTITKPTLFIGVPSKANFSLLLGREWIHGVGAVPSSMHQKIVIWREDGLVEKLFLG